MKSWEQKLVKTEQGELKAFDPITKELSDVGSGGSGGGGDKLVVTVTPSGDDYIVDTTYTELKHAIETNTPVYIHHTGFNITWLCFEYSIVEDLGFASYKECYSRTDGVDGFILAIESLNLAFDHDSQEYTVMFTETLTEFDLTPSV